MEKTNPKTAPTNAALESIKDTLEKVNQNIQQLTPQQEVSVEPDQLITFCKSILGNTPGQIEEKLQELKKSQKYPNTLECEFIMEEEENLQAELYLRDIIVELSFETLQSEETITAENAPHIIAKRKMKVEALKSGDVATYYNLHTEEPDAPVNFICSQAFVTFWHKYEFRNVRQAIEKTCLPTTQTPPTNLIKKISSRLKKFFINKYSLAQYSRWESGNIKIYIADQPHCIHHTNYIHFTFREQ